MGLPPALDGKPAVQKELVLRADESSPQYMPFFDRGDTHLGLGGGLLGAPGVQRRFVR
jgi:hypothetical protein